MTVGMAVLAGGVGRRIGRPFPKQFLLLGGKPLIIHVLEKARELEEIEDVVITCPEAHLDETVQLIRNHRMGTRFRCVIGGQTRQESVYIALRALEGVDTIILHEAVRPLVTLEEFRALLELPDANATYGLAIPFTVLKGHDYVEGVLDREELFNVQLPQKFDRTQLLEAHQAARRAGTEFTDDASLFVTHSDGRVRVLPGSDRNVKITVPPDIVMAEALYADLVGRRS
ncbi:MAG TPA: IspD/TarI family cytidylyltransferase [Candidatus Deferrimicrobiaceae bacterium]|nr:IspD/TarI family cytidylyltransferase [Candidatus Deferrimicrobiaceae bacterium]